MARNLDQVAFQGADLSGLDFSDLNLSNIIFYEVDLSHVDFTNSDLTAADLTGALKSDSGSRTYSILGDLTFGNQLQVIQNTFDPDGYTTRDESIYI